MRQTKDYIYDIDKNGNVAVHVYLDSKNCVRYWVDSWVSAREYASRIIKDGLWYIETRNDTGKEEVFIPVHRIYKVKVYEQD